MQYGNFKNLFVPKWWALENASPFKYGVMLGIYDIYVKFSAVNPTSTTFAVPIIFR